MAQNMKISIISQTGENILTTIECNETFYEFQQNLSNNFNVQVCVNDFKIFDPNLTENDNFFNCLKAQINEELLNLDDPPILQIQLIQPLLEQQQPLEQLEQQQQPLEQLQQQPEQPHIDEIKPETCSTPFSITENSSDIKNIEPSLIINPETQEITKILQDNIFETPNKPEETFNDIIQTRSSRKKREIPPEVPQTTTATTTTPTQTKDDNNYKYNDIESKLREIHDFREELITDFCRLCSKTILNKKIQIFTENYSLDEQINSCLPIKITKEDGLPQQLCESCMKRLRKHYDFMKQVKDADQFLKLKFPVLNPENNTSTVADFLNEFLATEKIQPKQETPPDDTMDVEYLDVEEIEDVSNTENFHCRICDLIIDNLKDALVHSARDHFINNLYACVFCEYGFETTMILSEHIQNEHKNFNKHQCKVCNKRFPYQSLLQKHVCINNQFKRFFDNFKYKYRCSICGKIFDSKITLLSHKKIHHNKCNICNKTFADRRILKEHEITHMKTKPYVCHICGKNLNRLSRLRTHLISHEQNELILNNVHNCNLCDEAFDSVENATSHENNVHDGKKCVHIIEIDKVFRCEFCDKNFSVADTLNTHRRCHNGPKPYVCHICNSEFSSYSRCATHKVIHGIYSDNPNKTYFPVARHFLCEHCNKSYLHWSHLGIHMKLKHSNTQSIYRCLDCNLEFPNSWGIAYHRKTKHSEEPIKCTECHVSVDNYEKLKEHRLKEHSNKKYNYQCIKCSKIFLTQEMLEEHLKIHQNIKENKCPYCPSSFIEVTALAAHLKIHRIKKSVTNNKTTAVKPDSQPPEEVSDRPYTCEECGLSFRKPFTLKSHLQKHYQPQEESNFVLMVDMKEDQNKPDEINQSIIEPSVPKIDETISNSEMTENFIDLGNGNYIRLQGGNTFNIDGKEYILVPETDKTIEDNLQNIEVPTYDQPMQLNPNLLDNNPEFNNAIMYVQQENSYIMNQNDDFIYNNDMLRTVTHEGTTYVLGNDMLLENNVTF